MIEKMCDSPILQFPFNLSDDLSQPLNCGGSLNDDVASRSSQSEVPSVSKGTPSVGSCNKNTTAYTYRFQLEQDVQSLRRQLQEETDLHSILENVIEKNGVKLSSPLCLPHHAKELLSNIEILEATVSKLEQEMVSLHFQLSQERNERRLVEYRIRHSSYESLFNSPDDIMTNSQISSSLTCLKHSIPELRLSTDDISTENMRDQPAESSGDLSRKYSMTEVAVDSVLHEKEVPMRKNTESCQPLDFRKLSREVPTKGLWENPNQLSEEMVRCMKNIFICLAEVAVPAKSSAPESHSSSLSPRGHLSNSSLWSLSERSIISSWVQSPQVDLQCIPEVLASDSSVDPYRVRGKLSWAEIGTYGLATEVSWMSVGKKQLEYAAGALRRFRTLVEQLAKVNPIHLSYEEKLAFWINLYNALIMHAYLAYGVPRSDLKLFSLMQKAAYTVGGHSFSAAVIEYVILKMKPPVHRPQIALLLALHKLKVSEEQRKFAIDKYEPLVAFALSSGMYSSPAVRIYCGKRVREELEEAQRDFIRASVGVSSKGRLLVPKMLHCFARGFVDDSKLGVWISHYLPPHQAAFVEQCISQRRQSILGSRNCGILPYDSRFRYLFLPENVPI